MADEARSIRDFDRQRQLSEATIGAYEVLQTVTGEAGVYDSAVSTPSSTDFELRTEGVFAVVKANGVVFLKGGRVYWDHSANVATYKKVSDRDFYIGRAEEDVASGRLIVNVRLNVDPRYDIDMNLDAGISVLAGTPAAGGFGYPVKLGGAHIFEITGTNEAQKVDWMSVDGFSVDSNAIVEMAFRVISDGSAGVQDFSLGIANGTHATDFTTITEFVSVHLDGDDTDIQIGSDDGTTDTAELDSTIDYTEGSPLTNRVEVWFDLRDKSDIQVYINGANVLPSSTFTLAAAAGPMFAIAHLEKTATTDTYKVAVDWLRVRHSEQ